MPAAETAISEALVVQLLQEQHPDLADLPVRFENEGWDSAIFRLGRDLAVRLPRRAINAALLPAEQRWLPELARQLPLPISAPVRVGAPGCGFPWDWSVTPWFDGASWADTPVANEIEAARVLGEFVRALATLAPEDAPTNPYRGGPLSDRDPAIRERLALLGESIDGPACMALWDAAIAAPLATDRRWVHGDLHPANIVIRDGAISAVVDFVDLCGGDTAYDLAAAWICFDDPTARDAFVVATGFTDADLWVRARACALSHGLACLASSADNPRMAEVGRRTYEAVLSDN